MHICFPRKKFWAILFKCRKPLYLVVGYELNLFKNQNSYLRKKKRQISIHLTNNKQISTPKKSALVPASHPTNHPSSQPANNPSNQQLQHLSPLTYYNWLQLLSHPANQPASHSVSQHHVLLWANNTIVDVLIVVVVVVQLPV